jgi:hypothetical protein
MALKTAIAAAALCSAAFLSAPASAMPIDNLAAATPAQVDQVRWVCGRPLLVASRSAYRGWSAVLWSACVRVGRTTLPSVPSSLVKRGTAGLPGPCRTSAAC